MHFNNVQRFTDGGFVVHRISGMLLSAWFDASGTMIDIEAFNLNRKPRRVTKRDRAIAEHVGAVIASTK